MVNDREKRAAAERLSRHICLKCGLCCDGTLFTHGRSNAEEAEQFPLCGYDSQKGKYVLPLPCPHHTPAGCSIHSQPRPAICGEYFCGLYESVAEGRLEPSEAQQVVDEIKSRVTELRHSKFLQEGQQLAMTSQGFDLAALRQTGRASGTDLAHLAAIWILLSRYIHTKARQFGYPSSG